jgi:hypothetical protein
MPLTHLQTRAPLEDFHKEPDETDIETYWHCRTTFIKGLHGWVHTLFQYKALTYITLSPVESSQGLIQSDPPKAE